MSESQRRVRVGTVSLFSLVMIISLAVMAMLSAATAKASEAQALTQETVLTSTYDNEAAAQHAVACIDAELARAAQLGPAEANPAELAAQAAAAVPGETTVEGSRIAMDFCAESGRSLHVELEIHVNYTYQITQWKAATHWADPGQSGLLAGL